MLAALKDMAVLFGSSQYRVEWEGLSNVQVKYLPIKHLSVIANAQHAKVMQSRWFTGL